MDRSLIRSNKHLLEPLAKKQKCDKSCSVKATPALSNLRRYQQSRKLRPKSVVDTLNHTGSSDGASSSVNSIEPESSGLNQYLAVTTPAVISAESVAESAGMSESYDDLSSVLESLKSDTLRSGSSTPFGSWSGSPVRSLPTSPTVHFSLAEDENEDSPTPGKPLRHLGLNRPRRLKTRMPTKPAISHPDGPINLGAMSPEMELNEGFDSFFGISLGSGSGATSATSLGSISEERTWSRNASADSSPQHRQPFTKDSSSRDEKKSSSLPRISEVKQVTKIGHGTCESFEQRSRVESLEKCSLDSGMGSAESKSREELSTHERKASGAKEHKKEDVNKDLAKEESLFKRKNSGGVKLLSSLFGRNSGSDIKDEVSDDKKSPISTKKQLQHSPLLGKGDNYNEERRSDKKIEELPAVPQFKVGCIASSNTFLSDLRTRQEKRASFFTNKQNSEEEKQDLPEKSAPKGIEQLSTEPIVGKVKMRLGAFAESKIEVEPPLPPKPGKALLKAPPLAPKPRPWSFASSDKSNDLEVSRSCEKTPEGAPIFDEKDEEKIGSELPKKSVKELAASLNKKPDEPKANNASLKSKFSPLLADDMTRSCHAAFGDFAQDEKGIKKLVSDDNEDFGENMEETHASISAISVKESSKKPSGSANYHFRKDYIKADNTVDV
ncbi:neurofilament heavy polypeptide-like [Artemia franciscana]|uniref:neurofilament heavy polypeptide-like n=1 Tax=Artemia franciscana TaxID=6661 RepID=UPI0032DBB0F6